MDTTPSFDDATPLPSLAMLVLLGINAALAASPGLDDSDFVCTPPSRN